MFPELDLSPSSDEEKATHTLFSRLERANFNHWIPHLKSETDADSETLCFLLISNFERWAKSSYPVILSNPVLIYIIRHHVMKAHEG
jgi:hypothetical protein